MISIRFEKETFLYGAKVEDIWIITLNFVVQLASQRRLKLPSNGQELFVLLYLPQGFAYSGLVEESEIV